MSTSNPRRDQSSSKGVRATSRRSTRVTGVSTDAEKEDADERLNEMKNPLQNIKALGSLVFCAKCDKELAAYYCSCETFLCTFDLITHVCATTLKQSYSEDLKRALR